MKSFARLFGLRYLKVYVSRDTDVPCIVGREDRQMIRPLRKQRTSSTIQV